MTTFNVSLKLVLIITCPMYLTMIFLLHQKNCLQNVFDTFKSGASDSRLFLGQNNSHLSRRNQLVLIDSSPVTVNSDMSEDETDTSFFNFISKLHFACTNSIRFGKVLDGGWDMCIAGPYRPQQPCLVYSFGISYDFSFDDAIARKFNCTVRSFDPSMKKVNDHQRSELVWFYKIGIGGKNFVNKGNWSLKTLPTIISSFSDTDKIIDYLKMDVENSEWSSLVSILANDSLSKVKQLGIELHFPKTDAKTLYNKYLLLKQLEDAGFRRWYFAQNYYHIRETRTGFRSYCYEMVYINTRFLKASDLDKK